MNKVGKTWWGRRFLAVLESFTEAGRLARGRQYLTGNRILHWKVSQNGATATIRGSVNPYYGVHEVPEYQTSIAFAPIPDAAWQDALALIGSRAGFVSRLLFNEMPDEIERPLSELGFSLLPASRADISSHCSCPDYENPCKHTAALYCLLAGRLDQDPFLLFELRGLTRADLIRRLRDTSLGSALASALDQAPPEPRPVQSFFTRPVALPLPATVAPREFWRGQRKLPSGVEPATPAAVAGILIRKGGDYPSFWTKEESFVEAMDAFYEHVRKKGKEWL